MIPHRLCLKNFLSYGSKLQEINFGNHTLICLSGKNGHGKSALLDAITWAIWGQARKISGVAKPDVHLLRLGQSSMIVIFDFLLGNQNYRIKREFALTRMGKPYASLEFGILDSDNTFKPLTEKTIRATQEKIQTILSLDFDSFINSAFLRQGQANEFSKKSPKERKDILCSILSLGKFELLRKKCSEKVKTLESIILQKRYIQEQHTLELQKESEYETQEITLQKIIHDIQSEEEALLTHLTTLKRDFEAIFQQLTTLDILSKQKNTLQNELTHTQETLKKHVSRWRTVHKNSLSTDKSSHLKKEKDILLESLRTQQQTFTQLQKLSEQRLHFKEQLQIIFNQIREQHTNKHTQLLTTITTLQAKQNTLSTQRIECLEKQDNVAVEIRNTKIKYDNLLGQIEENKKKLSFYETGKKQLEKKVSFYHRWHTKKQLLVNSLENIDRKMFLINNTQNPQCPLCFQNLSPHHKQTILDDFTQEKIFFTHQHERLLSILGQLHKAIVVEESTLQALEHMQKMTLEAQSQITQVTTHLTHLDQQQKDSYLQIEALNKEYEECEIKLQEKIKEKNAFQQSIQLVYAQNSEYQTFSKNIQSLEQEMKTLVYNDSTYQNTLLAIKKVEENLARYEEYTQEQALQSERRNYIFSILIQCRKQKEELQTLSTSLAQHQQIITRKQILEQEQFNIEKKLQELTQKKHTIAEQIGSLKTQKKRICTIKIEYAKIMDELKLLQAEINDYQDLAQAFGKDGIQALMIEQAIPEIEHEANNLLAQLTHNQAHIIIDSLRDLKKGGCKETLDIKVSDTMGIRPYELFSGGEAFRIDFALRIAISKLLARRSGTALQTLIIDEGFGSQDEEGLSLLMDALYKIQDNFEKIIVVSHLPYMKDQFPIHFHIQKNLQGSSVQVFEQA